MMNECIVVYVLKVFDLHVHCVNKISNKHNQHAMLAPNSLIIVCDSLYFFLVLNFIDLSTFNIDLYFSKDVDIPLNRRQTLKNLCDCHTVHFTVYT